MKMNKKTAIALFLLLIPTASAIAPLLIAGLAGAGLAGAIAYYVFGLQQKIEDLEAKIEYYQSISNYSYGIAKEMFDYEANRVYRDYRADELLAVEFAEKTKIHAWTLAKYTAIKTIYSDLEAGMSFEDALADAKLKATLAVYNYYKNLSENLVSNYNYKNLEYNNLITTAYDSAQAALVLDCSDGQCDVNPYYAVEFNTSTGTWTMKIEKVSSEYRYWVCNPEVCRNYAGNPCVCAYRDNAYPNYISNETVTLPKLGIFNISVCRIIATDGSNEIQNRALIPLVNVTSTLSLYDSLYTVISENLDLYLSSLTEDMIQEINVSDLLDPITVVTHINNAFNETGYYGFAALELAALGLNLTDINMTVTIRINNSTMSGILFTDWNGTLEVNNTYYADPEYFWLFLSEDGDIYDIRGYNFTVVDLRDKDGNQIQVAHFVKYVDHSGDIRKIYEELYMLNRLWERYLEMQAIPGGGYSIANWWNSLNDTQKILIAAAVVVVIILLARK